MSFVLGVNVSYVPMFKIAPKVLVGKIFFFHYFDCQMRLLCGCKNDPYCLNVGHFSNSLIFA